MNYGSTYKAVRSVTHSLVASLSAEDQMVQSCPEASPVKWHQAHTTWFFETFVLRPFLADYKPFREDFRWLFNSYYNSLGEEILDKKLWHRLLRRSASESGRLCHGNGGQEGGDRYRRVLMLAILKPAGPVCTRDELAAPSGRLSSRWLLHKSKKGSLASP